MPSAEEELIGGGKEIDEKIIGTILYLTGDSQIERAPPDPSREKKQSHPFPAEVESDV